VARCRDLVAPRLAVVVDAWNGQLVRYALAMAVGSPGYRAASSAIT